jgi:hypothetical protein
MSQNISIISKKSVVIVLKDYKINHHHGLTFIPKLLGKLRKHVKTLPCLGLPSPDSFKIVETDAFELGYGGILKQKVPDSNQEQIVHFHSGVWNAIQQNYSTIKKEILSIVLYISKF